LLVNVLCYLLYIHTYFIIFLLFFSIENSLVKIIMVIVFVEKHFLFVLSFLMKWLKQKIFLWVMIFALIFFGIEIYNEYMVNHTYYYSMLSNWNHWWMIVGALISAFIPLAYVLWNKRFNLKYFIVYLFSWLWLFGLVHAGIKESLMWIPGIIVLLINIAFLFALWAYFLTGIFAFGTMISETWLKIKQTRWQEMLISFWLWLGVFL